MIIIVIYKKEKNEWKNIAHESDRKCRHSYIWKYSKKKNILMAKSPYSRVYACDPFQMANLYDKKK